jgi:hypothetical protein
LRTKRTSPPAGCLAAFVRSTWILDTDGELLPRVGRRCGVANGTSVYSPAEDLRGRCAGSILRACSDASRFRSRRSPLTRLGAALRASANLERPGNRAPHTRHDAPHATKIAVCLHSAVVAFPRDLAVWCGVRNLMTRRRLTPEECGDHTYAGGIEKIRRALMEKLTTLPAASAMRRYVERLQGLPAETLLDEIFPRVHANPRARRLSAIPYFERVGHAHSPDRRSCLGTRLTLPSLFHGGTHDDSRPPTASLIVRTSAILKSDQRSRRQVAYRPFLSSCASELRCRDWPPWSVASYLHGHSGFSCASSRHSGRGAANGQRL